MLQEYLLWRQLNPADCLVAWLVGWPQKAEQLQKLAAAVSGAMENSTIRTFLLVRGQPSEPVTYFNLRSLQILANF